MTPAVSLFLDFNLPNATTWLYFSYLLAIAIFFKFSRLFSIRNWDIVTLFVLFPGLLVLNASKTWTTPVATQRAALEIAGLLGQGALPGNSLPLIAVAGPVGRDIVPVIETRRWQWYSYLWLICGSGYFLVRCLYDLVLVQRPALPPNLNLGGLAWFAGALLVCLVAVAFRQAERENPTSTPPTDKLTGVSVPPGPDRASIELARTWFGAPPWLASLTAVLCHVAVVAGLIVIGWRHFGDVSAGMAAATLYLMLPYTGLSVGQVQHVLPMALFVWVVASYRMPFVAGLLLGLTTAVAVFPLFMLPIWLSFYRGRGTGRFLIAFTLSLIIGLAHLGLLLWLKNGLAVIVRDVLAQTAWQPWRVPTSEGFWTGVHWAYRIPVFILFFAFVLGTFFWPVPKNLAQVLALSAAVPVGVQLWYADQGGVYVLWYLPLLLLLVFRPNLLDRRPPLLVPETDWVLRNQRRLWRAFRWLLQLPDVRQAAAR